MLRKNLGEGNYDYFVSIVEPDFDDDDYDEDYDDDDYDEDFDDDDYDEDYDDDETTDCNLPIDHLNMVDIVNAKSLSGSPLQAR